MARNAQGLIDCESILSELPHQRGGAGGASAPSSIPPLISNNPYQQLGSYARLAGQAQQQHQQQQQYMPHQQQQDQLLYNQVKEEPLDSGTYSPPPHYQGIEIRFDFSHSLRCGHDGK